jgi:fructokinase
MTDTMKSPVVCFGEVLWDILPSGTIPGGGPMKIAYHLRQLAVHPAVITSVGLDASGKKLIELFESLQISTDFFQLDEERQTGKITATLEGEHEINYDLNRPSAWDYIRWDFAFEPLMNRAEYFVFGSVAARNKKSGNTLFRLLEMATYRVFDVQLFPPHFSRLPIEEMLQKTDLLKLNISELEFITGWFTHYKSIKERVQVLQDKFNIGNIVVTRGSGGAVLNIDGNMYEHDGFSVNVVDRSGCGDAFLAGILYQMLNSIPLEESLEFANAIGALVTTKSGTCPSYQPEEIDAIISGTNNVFTPIH